MDQLHLQSKTEIIFTSDQRLVHIQWTSYIYKVKQRLYSLQTKACPYTTGVSRWAGTRYFYPSEHRCLRRVKNMLAMYLKYHKAGLTPTTPVTSTAISPVKMAIGHKSLTNLHSEMIFLQGKPVCSSPGPKVQVNYCHHLASVVCCLSSVVCRL
jgi:hypothetical protein